MIPVYTCSKYISVLVNEKRFVPISVSVFELKAYTLDHIGKKQMPICRICDPPRVSQTGLSLMLIRCAGMGAKISISVTMKGAQKN